MAIIDLRHLVTPEYDTIKFTGDIDKIEYELPMKKTVNSVLLLQENGAQSSGLAPDVENPPCRLADVGAG